MKNSAIRIPYCEWKIKCLFSILMDTDIILFFDRWGVIGKKVCQINSMEVALHGISCFMGEKV
jgi:hypothetical protein